MGVRSVDLVCTQDGVNGGGTVTGAGAGFARARGWNRGAVLEAAPVKVGFVSDLGSKIERDLLGGFLGSKYLQPRVYTDLEEREEGF